MTKMWQTKLHFCETVTKTKLVFAGKINTALQ